MPPAPWSFQLTYWGTTGSFPRLLCPADVAGKIVHTVDQLQQLGRLDDVRTKAVSEAELTEQIALSVPFEWRSTYGGNTTCLEISTPESVLVVDAGSGLQAWSAANQHRWNAAGYRGPREGHILMTHAHLDHTCALAFADAFYDPRNRFTIWAMPAVVDQLRELLCARDGVPSPLIPVTWQHLRGIHELKPIPASGEFQIAGTRITTISLNHPGNAIGYRLERGESRLVIATDHEQTEIPDQRIAEFARGADLLYLDAQYLQAEYDGQKPIGSLPAQSRRNWGHSSIEASIATAIAAEAKELHLGHHDPHRSDCELMQIERYAADYAQQLQRDLPPPARCRVRLAREASTWTLSTDVGTRRPRHEGLS
jgi:phosphoribosyl 1,2-cyclic phosphodiesterase